MNYCTDRMDLLTDTTLIECHMYILYPPYDTPLPLVIFHRSKLSTHFDLSRLPLLLLAWAASALAGRRIAASLQTRSGGSSATWPFLALSWDTVALSTRSSEITWSKQGTWMGVYNDPNNQSNHQTNQTNRQRNQNSPPPILYRLGWRRLATPL